ncbi:uncharacterized protein LOC134206773 [Armigeres subalbatus]|uniref:uncharacterized protein LOC134206773 n=1 Tax=Armigeres subalbatus TaxID=124917 RepID=UPI002ED0BFE7
MNWEHLVFELRRTYRHPDLDALIKMKIYQRRQQKQESFHEYYFEMEKLFRTMSVQISDYEKVQILQQNMRVDYKRQMTFIPIQDLETLLAAGQKLDALNFSAYNKVFGTEKSVQAVENHIITDRNRQKTFQHPNQQPKRISGNDLSGNQNKTNRNSAPQFQNNPSSSSFHKASSTPIAPRNNDSKEPIAGPSGKSSRPQMTLEQVVNSHKPPNHNTCFNCGTLGHHVVMCRQPRRLFCDNCVFWESATEDCYTHPTEVCHITYPFLNDQRPYVAVKVYGMPLKALLDSGSNFTIISENMFTRMKPKKLHRPSTNVALKSASGDELQILGQVQLPFRFRDRIKIVPTLVVRNLALDCICGMDFWRKFQIQPRILQDERFQNQGNVASIDSPCAETNLSEEESRRIDDIKLLFIPAKSGQLTITPLTEHRIDISDEWKNKPPVRQFPYVMSPKTHQLVAIELQRLLDVGIIERSNSDWSLNCVPVIKPSKVALEPGSRKYTAFSVQGKGLFQYTRMPFGLVNSPATLARLMDNVLGHGVLEPNVFVYLDDIVIVTETFEHHVQLLVEIARRLREANLSINLEKSKFGVNEIPFLGYLLSTNGLRTNPEKTRPIVEYERPNTVTKLRRFLGMANYYRRFIPNFSGVTAALTDLLQTKSKLIRWDDDAERAFCDIKECLITSPILGSPDFSREFAIQTDASDVAVAGVLTQQQEGGERIISYFSHKLTTPQKNYHAAEKEALAALLAIEAFRGYVEGYHFTLITDSSALTHILTTKWKVGSRCSRWALHLQQHNMTVVHRKGKENVVPDALSRSVAVVQSAPTTPWYDSMLQKVRTRPEEFVDFKVEDNILLKFVSARNDPYDSCFEWKIIPKEAEIPNILQECHEMFRSCSILKDSRRKVHTVPFPGPTVKREAIRYEAELPQKQSWTLFEPNLQASWCPSPAAYVIATHPSCLKPLPFHKSTNEHRYRPQRKVIVKCAIQQNDKNFSFRALKGQCSGWEIEVGREEKLT